VQFSSFLLLICWIFTPYFSTTSLDQGKLEQLIYWFPDSVDTPWYTGLATIKLMNIWIFVSRSCMLRSSADRPRVVCLAYAWHVLPPFRNIRCFRFYEANISRYVLICIFEWIYTLKDI
jgi:hypothetical protein